MPWVRLTHAETGKNLDLNLTPAVAMFPMENARTEIAYNPGLMYYVLETPDQIWAAIKAANHAEFDVKTYQPYIQVSPVKTITKTTAKPRKRK